MSTPRSSAREPVHRGWARFVAAYLLIVGVLNLLWGIAALANKDYFTEDSLLWSALGFWGVVALLLGLAQLAGAGLIFARNASGAIIASFLAFLGILVNFLSIGAYPIWSVILLVIDFMIIWATTVHSDEFVRS